MRSPFTRTRVAAAAGVVLTLVAMLRYPGGTFLDRTTHGYLVFQNFLSDLGMTVSHSGQPNRVGATCFIVGLCVLVVGFVIGLVGLFRLYSSPASRPYARAAAVVGLVVAFLFAGVALTPENHALDAHIQFTLLGFRVFPLATLLFALASSRDEAIPSRMTLAWTALTVVLAAYVALLQWGPNVSTPYGLTVQVAAQKVVATVAISVLLYQFHLADQVRPQA